MFARLQMSPRLHKGRRAVICITAIALIMISSCKDIVQDHKNKKPEFCEYNSGESLIDAHWGAYAVFYQLTADSWTIDWIPLCENRKIRMPFDVIFYQHGAIYGDSNFPPMTGERVSNQIFPMPSTEGIVSIFEVSGSVTGSLKSNGQVQFDKVKISNSVRRTGVKYGDIYVYSEPGVVEK